MDVHTLSSRQRRRYRDWIVDRADSYANVRINGTTYWQRLHDQLISKVKPSYPSKEVCERCNRFGVCIISDLCVRCHRMVCAQCVRLHHENEASICQDCYIEMYQEYIADAAIYGKKRGWPRRQPEIRE